ncbi:hypothetical protein QCA50_006567 [Cerrena zonata]|uniref:Uncharacterized protein n=1 Tax=Cerrena zonata TaxID=2478898 RepID=A0AAW0GI57_9APHY
MKSPSTIILPTHDTEHTGCRARKSSHTCYANGGALTAPPPAGIKQNMAAVKQSIGGSVPREPRSSKHAMVSAAPYYTEGNRVYSLSSPPPPPARAKYHKYKAFVSQV